MFGRNSGKSRAARSRRGGTGTEPPAVCTALLPLVGQPSRVDGTFGPPR
jgi:hypothetical protein